MPLFFQNRKQSYFVSRTSIDIETVIANRSNTHHQADLRDRAGTTARFQQISSRRLRHHGYRILHIFNDTNKIYMKRRTVVNASQLSYPSPDELALSRATNSGESRGLLSTPVTKSHPPDKTLTWIRTAAICVPGHPRNDSPIDPPSARGVIRYSWVSLPSFKRTCC